MATGRMLTEIQSKSIKAGSKKLKPSLGNLLIEYIQTVVAIINKMLEKNRLKCIRHSSINTIPKKSSKANIRNKMVNKSFFFFKVV
jgi:hypothetical protein